MALKRSSINTIDASLKKKNKYTNHGHSIHYQSERSYIRKRNPQDEYM